MYENQLLGVTANTTVLATSGTVYSVGLMAGAGAAATLTLREGGASGPIKLQLSVPQGEYVSRNFMGAVFTGSIYAAIGGAGAHADIEFSG